MALPSTRRSGLGGTATVTSDGGLAGDLYDGADIVGWTLTINQAVLDANTKSDTSEVKQIHRIGATIAINKLVAATAFAKSTLLGTILAIELTSGDGATLGGSGGDTVFSGDVVITKIGYTSPDGMEAEDIEAVTIDDAWSLAA